MAAYSGERAVRPRFDQSDARLPPPPSHVVPTASDRIALVRPSHPFLNPYNALPWRRHRYVAMQHVGMEHCSCCAARCSLSRLADATIVAECRRGAPQPRRAALSHPACRYVAAQHVPAARSSSSHQALTTCASRCMSLTCEYLHCQWRRRGRAVPRVHHAAAPRDPSSTRMRNRRRACTAAAAAALAVGSSRRSRRPPPLEHAAAVPLAPRARACQ